MDYWTSFNRICNLFVYSHPPHISSTISSIIPTTKNIPLSDIVLLHRVKSACSRQHFLFLFLLYCRFYCLSFFRVFFFLRFCLFFFTFFTLSIPKKISHCRHLHHFAFLYPSGNWGRRRVVRATIFQCGSYSQSFLSHFLWPQLNDTLNLLLTGEKLANRFTDIKNTFWSFSQPPLHQAQSLHMPHTPMLKKFHR